MASKIPPPSEREKRHIAAWLAANGIDTSVVPEDAAITADHYWITCEVFVRGDGVFGDEPVRSTITVPLQVPFSDLQRALADDAATGAPEHTLTVVGERTTRRGVRRWLACPVPGCGTRADITVTASVADGLVAAAAEAHRQQEADRG